MECRAVLDDVIHAVFLSEEVLIGQEWEARTWDPRLKPSLGQSNQHCFRRKVCTDDIVQ